MAGLKVKPFLRKHFGPSIDVLRELRYALLSLGDPLAEAGAGHAVGRPRILLIDDMLPDPRFGAGYPRAARLLESIIAARWYATVYPLSAAADQYGPVRALFPTGVRFLASRGRPGLRRLLKAGTGRFDAVLVSRASTMAAFAAACPHAPQFLAGTYCIYDAEAIFAMREAQRLALFGEAQAASDLDGWLDKEIALVANADAVVAVTDAEAAVFRERTRARVHVVSHGVELRQSVKPLQGRSNLLIVGRFTGTREQTPNVDSLVWFVDDVMPVLDTLIGADYRLVVVGFASDDLVRRLGSDRVLFKGIVDDVSGLYDDCRLFIAPTRFAAGIPLKVIEAAAAGIPCVVTNVLARQLGFENGRQALTADAPADFAACCADLYKSAETWTKVRDEGLRDVSARYSLDAFSHAVHAMLADCRSHIDAHQRSAAVQQPQR